MRTLIEEIRDKIAGNLFEFSKHAADRSIIRKIRLHEIEEAIANGRVIEDYPEDKYGASCLISGVTQQNRPIHIHCSYPSRELIKIVTVYEPDPLRWADNFTRRITNDE
jgi:Domain of unknown function (DUF4258)